MNLKQYGYLALAGLVLFAVGYSIGRFATPPKIQEKIVEKTVEQKNDNIHTVTVVVDKPDGTKTTTVTQDDKSTTLDTTKDTNTVSVTNLPDYTVKVGVGYSINAPGPVYMLSVDRRIIGSITLGAWGVTDGSAGLAVGMSF